MKSKILILFCGILIFAGMSLAAQDTPQIIHGTIDDDTPFVEVPIVVTKQGMTVIADINKVHEEDDLDTLLYLVDNQGNIVAENDDRARGDTNSTIVFPQADAITYTLIATRYKVERGDSSGDFEIHIRLVAAEEGQEQFTYETPDDAYTAALEIGFPELDVNPEAEWTILAYYGGDNNLEPGILNDFKEFELAGGSMESVRIIALVDRSPRFDTSNDDWQTTRLFEIGEDATGISEEEFPPTIDSEILTDLGNLEMDDGETLAQFLVWAIRHYPARHYVVAFASHGAGWQGIITDDTTSVSPGNYAILSIPELQSAFELATEAAGVETFDLLINDACLMSSIEYFAGISRFFRYSLASPEIVVDPALDMMRFTELLKEAGGPIDYEAVGAELVDLYIQRDILKRQTSDIVYLTHSVTFLENFDPLTAAVENFARVINRNPVINSVMLGNARTNAYTYTSFMGGNTRIDLGDLMQQTIALSTDGAVIRAAERVLLALNDARVYADAGERAKSRVSYYNIYFPDSSRDFKIGYFEESPLPEWGRMLRNYYNAVTPQVWSVGGIGFHLPVAPRVTFVSVYPQTGVNLLHPVVMTAQVVGRGIAYGDTTIDQVQADGTIIRMSTERLLTPEIDAQGNYQRINKWNPGVNMQEVYWDVTLAMVTNGEVSNFESFIFTEDVVFLDGRYQEPDSESWDDVAVLFSRETGDLQRIVGKSTGSDALGVVEIAPGSLFQVYNSIVTPDGRVSSEPGNTYIWPEDGLSWSWQPAPSGEYNLGLLMTAFGGTTGFDATTVEVDNEGVDPTLRSENWTDLGNILPRWADWPWYVYSDAEGDWGYYRSNNAANTENLTVYFHIWDDPAFDPTPENIAQAMLDIYERELVSDFLETTISGMPVVEYEYTYKTDAGTFRGLAFAYYNAAVDFGIIYAAEALDGRGNLNKVYTLLRDELTLYDPAEIENNSTWAFYTRSPELVSVNEVRYWIPSDWQRIDKDQANDAWDYYAPGGNTASPTLMATANVTEIVNGMDSLSTLASTFVMTSLQEYLLTGNRTYYGDYHTWDAVLYSGVRGMQHVLGRIYVTDVADQVYAIWVETPDAEGVATVINEVFEPIADSYKVTLSESAVVLELETAIDATSIEEPAILLRYDRRSLVLYNRWPTGATIDVSDLTFVQTPAEGAPISFAATEWGGDNLTALQSGDCYQALMAFYSELPANDFPTDICVWRQGYFSTARAFWTSQTPDATFEVRLGDETIGTCPTVPAISYPEFQAGDVDFGDEVRCFITLP